MSSRSQRLSHGAGGSGFSRDGFQRCRLIPADRKFEERTKMQLFHIRYRNAQGALMRILNAVSRRGLDFTSVHAEYDGQQHSVTMLLQVTPADWSAVPRVVRDRGCDSCARGRGGARKRSRRVGAASASSCRVGGAGAGGNGIVRRTAGINAAAGMVSRMMFPG